MKWIVFMLVLLNFQPSFGQYFWISNLTPIAPEKTVIIKEVTPFGRAYDFQIGLSEKSRVQLAVYDTTDQLVNRIDSLLNPGIYNLNWRSNSSENEVLPDGLYMMNIKIENGPALELCSIQRSAYHF
tara:strand:+ start:4051 stop:4431 length:381 start_codon:yes stop_codon:yes gene_type:complete